MADPTPTWNDFYNAGLGPQLPLTPQQRVQMVSGVLPSGESNGFDFRQVNINEPFPYPNLSTPNDLAFTSGTNRGMFPDQFSNDWWDASGIIKTYGPDQDALVDEERESGIFHFNEFLSQFSNAVDSDTKEIEDFTIFNDYIHHERYPSNRSRPLPPPIRIPYISTYRVAIDFNAYNGWVGFGGG
jgi:hypothetical protein